TIKAAVLRETPLPRRLRITELSAAGLLLAPAGHHAAKSAALGSTENARRDGGHHISHRPI
ncbi:hypothetical protein, partial [Pseudonocardia sp.]|uniref:hypothetical protein n=1 Tax=Pseudonocardia sp. TaxID=60912 RepID=UPI003D120ADC